MSDENKLSRSPKQYASVAEMVTDLSDDPDYAARFARIADPLNKAAIALVNPDATAFERNVIARELRRHKGGPCPICEDGESRGPCPLCCDISTLV